MRIVVLLLFIALIVLHQDFWLWDNRELVFGFIPSGLAYHAAYSLAAGFLGLLAIKYAWPQHLTELSGDEESQS